jgi:[ribosomal protein S18]-alanine N-acetyltransferase
MRALNRFRRWIAGGSGIKITPLLTRHSADIAYLQAGGGFARAWSPQECDALLTDAAVLADAAWLGGTLVGAVLSRRAADEAEILTIVTARDLRGTGIGRQLLAAHLAHLAAMGTRQLFLEVDAQNNPACALYRHFGFSQVGERPGYYPKADGSRVTALVMRRQL